MSPLLVVRLMTIMPKFQFQRMNVQYRIKPTKKKRKIQRFHKCNLSSKVVSLLVVEIKQNKVLLDN